ncbi:hypothetical protein VTO73DRAFT_13782 [Trametes versicolor]
MSDPSTSTVIAETIYAYQETRKENTINVVAATLLAYDALLCIGKELRYVWQSPNTPPTFSQILYLSNRYIPILWNVLYLGAIGKLSDTQRSALVLASVVGVLAALGPASFVTLRVYALSERNKISTGVVLLLITSAVVVGSDRCTNLTRGNDLRTWQMGDRIKDLHNSRRHHGHRCHLAVYSYCTSNIDTPSTTFFATDLMGERTMISLNIADMAIALSSATHATEATDIISFVEP